MEFKLTDVNVGRCIANVKDGSHYARRIRSGLVVKVTITTRRSVHSVNGLAALSEFSYDGHAQFTPPNTT